MRDRYPITGIKQSYRATPETRTVAMPIAISLLLVGLVAFYFFGKPETEAPPKEVTAVSELDLSARQETPTGSEGEEDSTFLASDSRSEMSPLLEESPATASEAIPAKIDTFVLVFTQWMSPLALDTYIRKKNEGFPESFWKRGHWITSVEGRWEEGTHEFRIAYEKIPDPNTWQWQYRANQTPEEFHRNGLDLQAKGFTLVQSQAFDHPDQQKRYQAVWHKAIQKTIVAQAPQMLSLQERGVAADLAPMESLAAPDAESVPDETAPVNPDAETPGLSAVQNARRTPLLPLPETEAPRIGSRQAEPPTNFGSNIFNVNRLGFR